MHTRHAAARKTRNGSRLPSFTEALLNRFSVLLSPFAHVLYFCIRRRRVDVESEYVSNTLETPARGRLANTYRLSSTKRCACRVRWAPVILNPRSNMHVIG